MSPTARRPLPTPDSLGERTVESMKMLAQLLRHFTSHGKPGDHVAKIKPEVFDPSLLRKHLGGSPTFRYPTIRTNGIEFVCTTLDDGRIEIKRSIF